MFDWIENDIQTIAISSQGRSSLRIMNYLKQENREIRKMESVIEDGPLL